MPRLAEFGVLIIIVYNLCFGLDIESAMSYKLVRDICAKPKSIMVTPDIKGAKSVIRKAAAKTLEKQSLIGESSTVVLQRRISGLSKVKITPNFENNLSGNNITFGNLTQSINDGQASFNINESATIIIRKDYVEFSHTY